MLERWTRGVIRWRWLVLACWLVAAGVGAISATRLPDLLTTSLGVPGMGSERAQAILTSAFGDNPEGSFTVVLRTRAASPKDMGRLRRRLEAATRSIPGARVAPLQQTAGVVYAQISTRMDLQDAERYTERLRHGLAQTRPHAYVTGAPALQHDLQPVLAADLRRGEAVAVPVALLILIAVLGLRGVLVAPILFAAGTIGTALGIVFLLAHVAPMPSYVPNLVEMVGLGLAVDYSLLVVNRFREEVIDQGRPVVAAIIQTMDTAGRAAVFSGGAVAIGLSAILIVPVPLIRSMGIAGVLVPLLSMVAALTLQPALLSVLGTPGLRRVPLLPAIGRRAGDRTWAVVAAGVIKKRFVVTLPALLLLIALALPATRLQLTPGALSSLPQSTESSRGLALLRETAGWGPVTPITVVLDSGARGKSSSAAVFTAVLRLARAALVDPQVFLVAIGEKAPYVDPSGRYRRIVISPRREFGDEATQSLVRRLRDRYVPQAGFPPVIHVSIGGAPAQGVDFLNRVYGTFPWIMGLVLLSSYVVLIRAFRSVLLPLVALLLDVLSVAAAYGLLVIVFRFGAGASVLGLFQGPQIEGWVPVFLFATLFGLSMDYQVFLVSRMREAWDAGAGTQDAIAFGLQRTGRIVSAAALIMVASFSGFVAGRVGGLQELGAGLALGVLIDATVVRILLMPGIMTMLGRWAWWMPAILGRLLRIETSPLAGREGRGLSKSA